MIGYKTAFFFSLFMLFYVYVGYPVCVWMLAHLVKNRIDKGSYEPMVSILISAYNEEEHIGQTITNKLQLDYPVNKIEIIVISDESTDKTDKIINSFSEHNVKIYCQKPRAGKTSALNIAVPHAKGEILVFSDANSIYASDALKHLVANFHDPKIGYVTGKMIYINPDGTPVGDGCSAYMKYENWLRKNETDLDSIVGVDGGIDAMRKDIYVPLKADQLPDFVQPLKVTLQGYRVVYEPNALLKESSLKKSRDEYRMRVRVSLRALWALFDMRTIFLPGKKIVYSWQIWSHKILRYLCFIFLIIAYLSNSLLLSEGHVYQVLFALQNMAYSVVAISPVLEKWGLDFKIFRLINYFVLINAASGHAFIKFLMGKKQTLWVPRKG